MVNQLFLAEWNEDFIGRTVRCYRKNNCRFCSTPCNRSHSIPAFPQVNLKKPVLDWLHLAPARLQNNYLNNFEQLFPYYGPKNQILIEVVDKLFDNFWNAFIASGMHGRLGILRTGENEERAFTWMKDSQDADLKEDKGIENGNCSKKWSFLSSRFWGLTRKQDTGLCMWTQFQVMRVCVVSWFRLTTCLS